MEIIGFIILLAGAFIGYKAEYIYKRVKGSDPELIQLILLKIVGLVIAILSMIIIFYR